MAEIRIDQKDSSGSERRTDGPRDSTPDLAGVRDEDLEPHAGLRYVARLFKVMALLLLFLLVAEVVLNVYRQGSAAIPGLLVEATRLIVFGGLLWGAADLALMLIESNHDLRATRILVGRLNGKVQRLESMSFGQGPQSPPPAGGAPPRVEVPREPR